MDAAQKLFIEKGYAKTTVMDILNVHGLSKGVFYYYFQSKEEVMDAIIGRIVDASVDNAKKIVANPQMTPPQKLCAILMGQGQTEELNRDRENLAHQFHETGNAEMHQKSLVQSIKRLAPVMAEILKEDGANIISTDYPQETVALFLAAGQTIFDEGFFSWSEEERPRYCVAFIEMMEKTLGVPTGYFNDVKKIFA